MARTLSNNLDVENDREDLQRLLTSSEPLRKLQPFFSNWEEVLSFHARQMSARFPVVVGGETSGCAACEAPQPLVPTTLHWRATFGNTRTALVTLLSLLHHSAYMQLDFETHHRFCATCYRRTVLHRFLAELTRWAVFIIFLLLGGIFAMSLLWLIVVVLDFTWANFGWFALAFFTGGFGVVGGLWAKAKMDRWCIPVPLRFIGKYPFVLYGIKRTKGKKGAVPGAFCECHRLRPPVPEAEHPKPLPPDPNQATFGF